jgi:ABC-type Mn2+/Zn2+ transport system ATPase subunit
MNDPLIEYRNVYLGYGNATALGSVNFVLRMGDFLGVVGPNGSGKTTLLRSMFGLIRPMRGEIVSLRPGLRFGYVPQRQDIDARFPLTAFEVARMGLFPEVGSLLRLGRSGNRRVLECLERTGVCMFRNKLYGDLSGGQKQRVLIARALVRNAHVLLLDEPTHDIDISAAGEIMELVDELHSKISVTVVLVTHLLDLVERHADRLAVLKAGTFVTGRKEEMFQVA